MSEPIRALFSEHQVLAAADLTQVVDHARNVDARHGRYLHTPGIAFGLELAKTEISVPQLTGPPKPAKDITLTPGVFVDGHGQLVVVSSQRKLSSALIDGVTPQHEDGQPEGWSYLHPLFIVAAEVSEPPADSLTACESGFVTRVVEGYELVLGAPDDALRFAEQRPAAPGEDLSTSLPSWRLLLGFVRIDIDIRRFVGVADEDGGIRRQYAGVHAGNVTGHGGSIELRPAASDAAGPAKLVVGERELVYGPVLGSGDVDPVFTVTAAGDVAVKGSLTPELGAGVRATSGVATHGVVLPLPDGITEEHVERGRITVHTTVSPVLPPFDPANPASPPTVYQCSVDTRRRLSCVIAPIVAGGTPTGSANYLLLTAPAG